MPTKAQVQVLAEAGLPWPEIGARLDVPAGQAYLIGTGRPADGSSHGGRAPDTDAGVLGARAQALVNDHEVDPTGRGDVRAWIKTRAFFDGGTRGERRSDPEDGGQR